MSSQADRARDFLALHVPGRPLLMPNPWDVGSARLLASMGFAALATTSSGFAATLGLLDYAVTRDQALDHAAALVAAVDVPVSADLQNGFGTTREDVTATARGAVAAGLAGFSIEDSTGDAVEPVFGIDEATERVAAAAAIAHADHHVVLTARAENHLHGRTDLAETIARLQAYAEAGADVLFAPGVVQIDDVRALVAAVDRPVNVLALNGCPPVAELAAAGVARVSVGGAFAYAALAAVVEAGNELLHSGTYGYLDKATGGRAEARAAFGR